MTMYPGWSFCVVEIVFTDQDDYSKRRFHVVPGRPNQNRSGARSSIEYVAEILAELAKDASEDVGWPAYASDPPWDSTNVERDDNLFYILVPSDMLLTEDEFNEMSDEERESVQNDISVIALTIYLGGCHPSPKAATQALVDKIGAYPLITYWCVPGRDADPEPWGDEDAHDVLNDFVDLDLHCDDNENDSRARRRRDLATL